MKKKKLSELEIIKLQRREFIAGLFASNGFLGLRAMLLGFSPSFLVSRAIAAEGATALIFSTDNTASPVNCNAPGTFKTGFDHATVEQAGIAAQSIAPTSFTLGNTTVSAAKRWSEMPNDLRERFHFFHHTTNENAHPNARLVLTLNGKVRMQKGSGSEMIPSAIAQSIAESLGTISVKPMSFTRQFITYDQVHQPYSTPASLKQAFGSIENTNQKRILSFRDRQIDKLYADVKSHGTIRQVQHIDNHALSRNEARSLIESMGSLLSEISGNTTSDEVLAAAASIAAKAAPVAIIGIRFGGDNHGDTTLIDEINGHNEGITNIELLWNKLKSFGVADSTTFALQNVFGRTIRRNTDGGRDHNRSHSVMLMFGPNIKGGVTGDVEAKDDYEGATATGINSLTGNKINPDIGFDTTLASSGKTLMKACGINENTINERIPAGKIVRSAIKR